MTQHIRVMMHGLTSEVPIMYCLCACNHSFTPAAAGCQLLETQEGLSEMQFDDTCELSVWPGESRPVHMPKQSRLLAVDGDTSSNSLA